MSNRETYPFNINDLDATDEFKKFILWHLKHSQPGTTTAVTETTATAAALGLKPQQLAHWYKSYAEEQFLEVHPIDTPPALASYTYQRVTLNLDRITEAYIFKNANGIVLNTSIAHSPELLALPLEVFSAHMILIQLSQVYNTGGVITDDLLEQAKTNRLNWYTAPHILQRLKENGLLAEFKEPMSGVYMTRWHAIGANCALQSTRPDKTTAAGLLGLTSTPPSYWQLTPRAAAAKNIPGIEQHPLPIKDPGLIGWTWDELKDPATTE